MALHAFSVFSVQMSIPIIMGANIGTSVTGILVAVTQAGDLATFERAFSGATVHDMFNWLTVITLLPIEIATGYLYHVTSAVIRATDIAGDGESTEFLSVLTKPFTKVIVQVQNLKSNPGIICMYFHTEYRFYCIIITNI